MKILVIERCQNSMLLISGAIELRYLAKMIKFLRKREIGLKHMKCPIEIIELDYARLKIVEMNMLLDTPFLTEIHLTNCVGLVDDSRTLVSMFTQLKELRTLRIQRTTYLQPDEVVQIISTCCHLTWFAFTPVWKRVRNSTNQWIQVFNSKPDIWGPDFRCLFLRIKHSYMSDLFYSMYKDAPEWARTDRPAESESETDSDYY